MREREDEDDTEALFQEAMLERMQMLEEALERARAGVATAADWETIRMEAGAKSKTRTPKETTHELGSERRRE